GGAYFGVAELSEALRQLRAELMPWVVLVGREERHLARPDGCRVAVEGNAGAVRAAVGELPEHRAQVRAEVLLNVARLAEQPCYATHLSTSPSGALAVPVHPPLRDVFGCLLPLAPLAADEVVDVVLVPRPAEGLAKD